MKVALLISYIFCSVSVFCQIANKENLTKKVTFYWDFNRTQILSTGSYYKDELSETTEKHGKWLYYDRFGVLEEERNYYRDALEGKVLLYFPNKKLKQEGYFHQDKQDSIYKEWYENGILSVEGCYKMGSPVKMWTYYYIDGKKKSQEELKDSTNYVISFWLDDATHTQTVKNGNGELFTYFANGTVKEWYHFENGLKHGYFEDRLASGSIALKGYFNQGKKDSTWTYSYYTGTTEKISNYKNGVLDGEYAYYYDNGALNVTGFYSQGKKTGKWSWYTNQGSRDMEGTFEEDEQHGDWTYWYPIGELSYTAHYTKGLKTGTWTYFYKNGKLFKEGSFVADEKNGVWKTWYENEVLLMEGTYVNGKEQGEWVNYWEDGTIKNQTTFKNGQLNGKWVSYYPSGKLKLQGEYDENFKVGEWIDYFENGKPRDIITYKVFNEKTKMDYGVMKNHVYVDSKMDGHATSFSPKDYQKTEEGDYKEGLKTGEWIAYYPGGKYPAVISHYKKGELDGIMKQYSRRGQLLQEIEYKEGVKHGKFILYNSKGKSVVVKQFENGIEIIKEEQKGTGSFAPRG